MAGDANGMKLWSKISTAAAIPLVVAAVGYGELKSEVANNREDIAREREYRQELSADISDLGVRIAVIDNKVDQLLTREEGRSAFVPTPFSLSMEYEDDFH